MDQDIYVLLMALTERASERRTTLLLDTYLDLDVGWTDLTPSPTPSLPPSPLSLISSLLSPLGGGAKVQRVTPPTITKKQ